MALTAVSKDGVLFDSTDCADEVWSTVHRAPEPARLRCRECNGTMVAKVSKTGLRFFSHWRRPDTCAMEGESAAHRELKHRIASLIRQEGFEAIVEAAPAADDVGGWRADVLGLTPKGRRVAFEVQLAGMTVAEGQERTQRYARDNIRTLWVSTKHAVWISSIPSARLRLEPETVTADRGLARLDDRTLRTWKPAGEVDFARIVRGMLNEAITTVSSTYISEQVGERDYHTDDAVLLVPVSDLARYDDEVVRQRRDRERHVEYTQKLQERQRRGVPVGMRDALSAGHPSHHLRHGHEGTLWDGNLPPVSEDVYRDPRLAMGVPIWLGSDRQKLLLWAVICPVASRITDGIARQWRLEGVRVYAETAHDATRLANALRWPPQKIHLFSPEGS